MKNVLTPSNALLESLIAVVLLVYIFTVLVITKKLFSFMVSTKKMRKNVAVYYNRKIIHILAGGITALLVPFLFTSPLIPAVMAYVIAILLSVPHRRKKLLNWFQTSENAFEVNFCVAWGTSLLAVWLVTGNPHYAIVPPLFIAIGDAVTGIIRNGLFGRRTKSWIGNIGMIATTIPIGLYYAGLPGLVAAVLASIVEHFEFPPLIDDNILITLVSSIVIVSWSLVL